jgi:hemolysin activation/secretion protein
MRRFAILLASAATVTLPQTAGAQGGANIIDRDRADRVAPVILGPAQKPPNLNNGAPVAAAFRPFRLTAVRVDGSSLAPSTLAAAYQPYVGRTLDAPMLAALARDVSVAYAQSDVALYSVGVPAQDFAGGQLRLVVAEGRVANGAVHVAGDKKVTPLIVAQIEKLTPERPLRRVSLERRLSLIRDIPGLTINADMQRTTQPGAVRMVVDATQRSFDWAVNVTNRGTAFLGRTQVTFDGTLYSLLRGGDSTRFTFVVPTVLKRFQYYAVNHRTPLGDDGMTLTVGGGYLRTRPKGTDLRGDAALASATVSYPVLRGYDRSLYVSGGLDGVDSHNALFGRTISDERTRALRLSAAYGKSAAKSALSLNLAASHGVEGLGARTANRALARPDFAKVTAQASYDRVLGKTAVARLRLAGQHSGDPLPGSELFSLGGEQFGRAFQSAYATGDTGYAGAVELGWRPGFVPKAAAGSELYGFADAGRVKTRPRLGFETDYRLASAGVGARLAVAKAAVVQIEAAKALRDTTPGRRDAWQVTAGFKSTF